MMNENNIARQKVISRIFVAMNSKTAKFCFNEWRSKIGVCRETLPSAFAQPLRRNRYFIGDFEKRFSGWNHEDDDVLKLTVMEKVVKVSFEHCLYHCRILDHIYRKRKLVVMVIHHSIWSNAKNIVPFMIGEEEFRLHHDMYNIHFVHTDEMHGLLSLSHWKVLYQTSHTARKCKLVLRRLYRYVQNISVLCGKNRPLFFFARKNV